MNYALMMLACLSAAAEAIASPELTAPSYITDALNDPARPAKQVEQDFERKAVQVIAFAGIKPADKVADFMPGNGYFTRLFSHVVGPGGHIYAYLPSQQIAHCEPQEIAGTKELEHDKRYANVQVLIAASDRFATPEQLDMVFTAQDYHDLHDKFMAPTNVAKFNAAVFKALKPGGVFVVIDHAAEPGSGLRDTETLHRIDPETIRSEVANAGFVFESQSDILRNSADNHTLIVFDPAVRHKTDQVALKFRKPTEKKTTALDPQLLD